MTECIGGGAGVTATDLNSRYHSHCDPRLNAEQALEMAFYAASRLRQREWPGAMCGSCGWRWAVTVQRRQLICKGGGQGAGGGSVL